MNIYIQICSRDVSTYFYILIFFIYPLCSSARYLSFYPFSIKFILYADFETLVWFSKNPFMLFKTLLLFQFLVGIAQHARLTMFTTFLFCFTIEELVVRNYSSMVLRTT